MRSALPGALLAFLLAVPAMAAEPSVGQAAPALRITRLDGTELDLAALHGQVVVLNFWATWCAPCRAEMPMLDAFYSKHRAEGVVVVGLSADDRHDRRDVERIAHSVSYPAALLAEARANGFGNPVALPMTYVIDTQGVIRGRLAPARVGLTEDALAAVVLPLLTAGAPRAP